MRRSCRCGGMVFQTLPGAEIGDAHQEQAGRRHLGMDVHAQRALVGAPLLAEIERLGLGLGDQPVRDVAAGGHRIHVEPGRLLGIVAGKHDLAAAAPDIEHVAVGEPEFLSIDRDAAGAAEIGDAHLARGQEELGADLRTVAEAQRCPASGMAPPKIIRSIWV